MVKIEQSQCIGCGACAEDCLSGNLALENGCAAVRGDCIQCGHCVAICPTRAVSIPAYTMADVTEYRRETFEIPAGTLLNFIKFRRSIRQFQPHAVEDEKIRTVIEAGRYVPTGGNRQNVRYILVRAQIQTLRGLILKQLSTLSSREGNAFSARYADRFHAMYQSYLQDPDGTDGLFFHAPLVLLAVSDDVLPAALATVGMELQANALGLGCLYSGFSTYAINLDVDCRALLGLTAQEQAVTALVIGYPAVTYLRTAPRKAPDITEL